MYRRFSAVCLTVFLAGAAHAIGPGQWVAETELTELDMTLPPGAPAGMEDMIKQRMAEARSITQCISQEDIDNAPERLFTATDGQCKFGNFDMSGGQVDAAAQCDMQGVTMAMNMSGTHDDDSYEIDMVMDGETPMGPMSMAFKTIGTRTGPCS